MRVGLAAAAVLLAGSACGRPAVDDEPARWRPQPGDTWQWQLQGSVNTAYDVDVYDVDLAETPRAVLDELRSGGRRVVCYFSAGTWEAFRPGAPPPDGVLGAPLADFPDERWLDIRRPPARALAAAHLDRARSRGCDGVEPDNVDGYANDTGFDLTAADQLAFNRWLAGAAHDRGLAVGLKNDLDQVALLAGDFDFAVDEQCHEFDECAALAPFLDARKPVFNAEYDPAMRRDPEPVCAASRRLGLRTLILPYELDDSFRVACDERSARRAPSVSGTSR
jgi:hypothetical protein